MELNIVREQLVRFHRFTAYQGHQERGILVVYQKGDSWVVEEMHTRLHRKGVGASLLKEFTNFIGGGITVEACLVHRPSIKAIRQHGLFPEQATDKVIIDDPEKLSLLPMTRLFKRGGIAVTSLQFLRLPHNKKARAKDIYDIYLYGITEPDND